jgi:hypothetical protein
MSVPAEQRTAALQVALFTCEQAVGDEENAVRSLPPFRAFANRRYVAPRRSLSIHSTQGFSKATEPYLSDVLSRVASQEWPVMSEEARLS